MTAIIKFEMCMKQQKERACKERFVVMPLRISGNRRESCTTS